MSKIVYNNLTYGEVGDDVLGRPDLIPYSNGVSHLENFDINLLGGVQRRKGLRKILPLDSKARIIDFVFDNDLAFLIILGDGKLQVYNSRLDRMEAEFSSSFEHILYSAEDVNEVQYAQDSNSVYMVHRLYAPLVLAYVGGGFQLDTLVPDCDEENPNLFQKVGDYPSVLAFYSNRLILASSDNNPYRIWISKAFEPKNFWTYDLVQTTEKAIVGYSEYALYFSKWKEEGEKTTISKSYDKWYKGELLNSEWWKQRLKMEDFDGVPTFTDLLTVSPSLFQEVMTSRDNVRTSKTVSDADAMILDLGSNKNDRISWIGVNYNILVGTASSEWVISANISALEQTTKQVSAYGGKRVQAVVQGGKVYFMQTPSILRTIYYDSQTYSYPCDDKTQFNRDILESGVVEVCTRRTPKEQVYLVLNNGTLAVLTQNSLSGADGFNRISSNVGAILSCAIIDEDTQQNVYVVLDNSKTTTDGKATEYYLCAIDSEDNKDIGAYNYVSRLVSNPIENGNYNSMDNTKYGYSVSVRCRNTKTFKVGYEGASLKVGSAEQNDIITVQVPTTWTKDLRLAIESIEDEPLNVQALMGQIGMV